MFKYEMGAIVMNARSGEQGEVVGRAEHAHSENHYRVRYTDASGRARTDWWDESEIG